MIPRSADGLPEGWPAEHGVTTVGIDVLAWAEAFLAQPDGDEAGRPWRWTDAQARFVAWWYAVDRNGRWLFRRAQVVLPKGAGKSPLAAALSCVELAGPVRFDGFDAAGNAVGKPHPSPWVQLSAVSQDQTTNTMSLVLSMVNEGEASDLIEGLDTGVTRVLTRNGRLDPVAASASSREGQRLSAAVLDETHHWMKANGGHRLAQTIRRNLGKMGGRSIETTNAWSPGLESVAELTGEYAALIEEGKVRDEGLLRWHRQAPADTRLGDEASLRAGLEYVYADSPWIDIDRVIGEVQDPGTPPEQARRFYLNQIVAAEDSLVSTQEWDAGTVEDRLEPGDEITLGFDGGKTDDATVLIAMRVRDRLVQPLGIWERPDGADDWQVDRETVDGVVRNAMSTYRVSAFFADVALWESYIDQWSLDYRSDLLVKATPKSVVGYDMRGNLSDTTRGNERLIAAIADGLVLHTEGTRLDAALRRHVLNTRRRLNRYGVSFGKEHRESKRKVDGYAGMLLADMARMKVLESGKRRGSRKVVILS